MLERIPEPLSPDAADHADRLRLIACDLRLIDLATTNTRGNGFEFSEAEWEAVRMHLDRLVADVESLMDDVVERDRAKGGK